MTRSCCWRPTRSCTAPSTSCWRPAATSSCCGASPARCRPTAAAQTPSTWSRPARSTRRIVLARRRPADTVRGVVDRPRAPRRRRRRPARCGGCRDRRGEPAACRAAHRHRRRLLEHPGYAVSYWNLHERPLAADGERLTAAGQPLRLMRFPGFRPDRPWWLSEHASRVPVLDDPRLSDARAACSQELSRRLDGRDRHRQRGAGTLPNGLRFDMRLRRMYVEALEGGEDFGDILQPAGARRVPALADEPGDAWRRRRADPLPRRRLARAQDVQVAYPDLEAPMPRDSSAGCGCRAARRWACRRR